MTEFSFVEAYLKTRNRKEEIEIFWMFRDNPLALTPTCYALDNGHLAITCGFRGDEAMNRMMEKVDSAYPGRVDWR